MQPYLENIINDVSKKLDIPYDVCCRIYMSMWHFIEDKVKEHHYKDMTLEEFTQIRPNFNLPSLGKLCVTQDRFKGVMKSFEMKRLAGEQKRLREANQDVQDKEDSSEV